MIISPGYRGRNCTFPPQKNACRTSQNHATTRPFNCVMSEGAAMNSPAKSAEQLNPRQIKVLLFGASGMLGTAVMRECLADPQATRVVSVGRTASALHSAKLEEIVHADLSNYRAIETSLGDLDACFFCLGVSSAGLSETEYSR